MNVVVADKALDEATTRQIVEEFYREGSALVPGVLHADEIAAIRAITDEYAQHPEQYPKQHISYAHGAFVLRRGHEVDPVLQAMVTREPIVGLVEAILGKGAAFNALNVIRNEPGTAISVWHLDDTLEHPLPEEITRFDARIRMPVLWLTVQCALSDIDSMEHGPTQFVPGSHYSGRYPPKGEEAPQFEGREPRSLLCRAGDIYFTNHQCWHRGAPNTSDRTRYVMQLQYAQRWADRRFRGVA
jgi:ectoine hydroxylase-related dioxygenase (phytanoyl-CoA dioxygenase family)